MHNREAKHMTAMNAALCYQDGRPYHPLRSITAEWPAALPQTCRTVQLTHNTDWAAFWKQVSAVLQHHNYCATTRAQYRTVLRGFYRYARSRPAVTDARLLHRYIQHLTAKNYSWQWVGMNISILRTVFDKIAGRSIAVHLATPSRGRPLPEILNRAEVRDILSAASSTRDQILLGMLYGCGLKVSELCALKWGDVDTTGATIQITGNIATRSREHEIPPELLPVLAYGKQRCNQSDLIFQGRSAGTALSTRMVELIVRRAAAACGCLKPVTAMTLRHSYAVHCLENGRSIRALQKALGHLSVKTTMLYQRCILPPGTESPLDRLKRGNRQTQQALSVSREPDANTAGMPKTDLFQNPLSLQAIELPFTDQAETNSAGFYSLLKTHIIGRFLCRRRAGP